jgi:hypothetical protein
MVAAVSAVLPAQASSLRAQAYLSARNQQHISHLSISDARRSGGHHGKVVEWAGTVEGMAATGDGVFMMLRLSKRESIPVRLNASGSAALGSSVYVLGKLVESNGFLNHVEPIAIAPCNDVAGAYKDMQRRYQVAQEARSAAHSPALSLQSSPIMKYDARTLAMRAPGQLSLRGAIQWIHSFNKNLDDRTTDALARAVLYNCGTYNINARLALSLFAAESAFRTDAVSSVGAQGLGQLMPETAAMLGVRDPNDALQNIEGSVRYLSSLLSRWQSSPQQWQLALASYNAGTGAVEQYGGIPPYPETINYVGTILGYYGELSHIQ